ncbi:hypothetical protein E2C01_062383 [Portunus trituberculatus]|uniref:Uncharacterized protein n=1 Tax=Portunus trituberculatus TaxID=210409 RepID=A0A5B7HDW6_PORTR|nr:hypothetical protein [Portunus trituberculatus]
MATRRGQQDGKSSAHTAPQAGKGTATVTLTPAALPPPQAQAETPVTPCVSVVSVARSGATGGKTGSVRDTDSVKSCGTHPSCSASLNTASPPATRPKAPSQISSSVISSPHPPPLASGKGGVRVPAPLAPCSIACTNNYYRLSKELQQAKDQIFALSVQVSWSYS